MPYDAGRARASSASSRACARRRRAASASRSRPASTSPTKPTPTAPRCSPSSRPLLDAGVDVVPARARRHPECSRASRRARPTLDDAGSLDALRARRADARCSARARPSTSARGRRRTSASSPRAARRRRRDVDRARPCARRRSRPTTPARWRDALGGRPLLVWDNYPVNDAMMSARCTSARTTAATPSSTDVVGGVLCNPMIQPRASLGRARDRDGVPPRSRRATTRTTAWERAIADVGGDRADASLRVLARACADGPLAEPDDASRPRRVVDARRRARRRRPTGPRRVAALRDELARAPRDARHGRGRRPDDPLAAEVAPWLERPRARPRPGWPRCA